MELMEMDAELQDAEAYYGDRLNLYPDDLWALNNLALVSLRLQDTQGALGYVQQALNTHHQVTEALHNTLVLALMQSNQPELANSVAQQVIQIRQALDALTAELSVPT
jgi:tetratricopeptide (TPR) repeat protein